MNVKLPVAIGIAPDYFVEGVAVGTESSVT